MTSKFKAAFVILSIISTSIESNANSTNIDWGKFQSTINEYCNELKPNYDNILATYIQADEDSFIGKFSLKVKKDSALGFSTYSKCLEPSFITKHSNLFGANRSGKNDFQNCNNNTIKTCSKAFGL